MSQSSSQPDSLTDPVRQDPKPWDIVGGRRGIRLSTLSMMGWRALAGEIIVLLFTGLVLKLKLPVLPCALVVATGGLLNIGLVWVRDRDATDKVATVVLCLVNLQVTALLYFNGGVANPFAVVLIAPAVLAAATCKTNQALIVALTAYVAVLALTFWSWPLPWVAGETMSLPKLYIDGCGAALGIGIGFTAAYSWRASVESERMELALNVAHSALAREQRLSDLGALAAAAAHELGTPPWPPSRSSPRRSPVVRTP